MTDTITKPNSTTSVDTAPKVPEREAVLDLVTDIAPAKLLRVGGEEYDLLGLDHLTPETEAQVTATFTRFQSVYERLEAAPNMTIAANEAGKLQRYREKLIQLMTTIPPEVIKTLHAGQQGKILAVIRTELQVEEELEGAESEGDDFGGEDS